MASSSTRPLLALSPNGKRLAYIPRISAGESTATTLSILRVLLFSVESSLLSSSSSSSASSLQTTLTHRFKPGEETTATETTPFKLLFVGGGNGDYLLLTVYSNQILAWDLNRGVVAYTIRPHHASSQIFMDVCSDTNNHYNTTNNNNKSLIYALTCSNESGKVTVYSYHVSTGKLESKIKAGKGGQAACGVGIVVTEGNANNGDNLLVVRQQDTLRIMTLPGGKKLFTVSSLEETNAGNQNLAIAARWAATMVQGQIVLIDCNTGERKLSIPVDSKINATMLTTTTTSALAPFDLWSANQSSIFLSQGEMIYKISTVDCSIEKTWSCPVDSILDRCFRLGYKNIVVALLVKDGGQYQVVTSLLEDDVDKVDLSWKSPESSTLHPLSLQANDKKNKRKEAPTVLGPAQTGGEAFVSEGPTTKKSKIEMQLDSEEQEDKNESDVNGGGPTLGERLQLLRKALDEESSDNDDGGGDSGDKEMTGMGQGLDFMPKQATTESLGKVLEQGLRSGEEKLLELALSVRDANLLTETCQELPDELLPPLLNALTSRLASKGSRAELLCTWISVLLRSGRIRSMAHLQPLRNLIQERIEVFPDLLKLQGRLSLMIPPE